MGGVRVHVLRHAKAEKRSAWGGPDALRPLAPEGLVEARRFPEQLGALRSPRILTSPHLRCRQTIGPLAERLGVPLEAYPELAKGEPVAKAADLVSQLASEDLVCCTHPDLARGLRSELAERGLQVRRPGRGSVAELGDPSERLAVLDMGSTSFHLLVADVTEPGRITPVDRESVMLRLGASIANGGSIPEPICERAVESAERLRHQAERLGATRILSIGTAALRDASNGATLALRLGEALGGPVRIASGEEEGRLTWSAFQRRVRLPAEGFALGLDLGGGSLEIVAGRAHGAIDFERSLPLGVTRLRRTFIEQDPPRKREIRAITERVTEALAPIQVRLRSLDPELAVLAGGTSRALGSLVRGMRGLREGSVNEFELDLATLRETAEILLHTSHAERLRLPGMRRRRADLIPVGALILLRIAEILGLDRYVLCDWGLREAVLLEARAPHDSPA